MSINLTTQELHIDKNQQNLKLNVVVRHFSTAALSQSNILSNSVKQIRNWSTAVHTSKPFIRICHALELSMFSQDRIGAGTREHQIFSHACCNTVAKI
jgi:hypothetical protein